MATKGIMQESPSDRAARIFEEYLALEEVGKAPPWFAVVACNPDLSEELDELHVGHRLLERALTYHRRRQLHLRLVRRCTAGALAATLLLAVIIAALRHELPPSDIQVLQTPSGLKVPQVLGPIAYETASTTPPTLQEIAAATATVRAVNETLAAPTEPLPPASQAESPGIDTELDPGLVLLADAGLRGTTTAAATDWSRKLVAALQSTNELNLVAIDLDGGGRLATGLAVYAQKVDLISGQSDPPIYLGTTPLAGQIGVGDHHITVIDRVNSRYSELRVLSAPRTAIPHQLAFVRAVAIDDPATPMASLTAGSIGLANPGTTPDLSPQTPIDGYYLDRYESSIGQYRAFLADLRRHENLWRGTDPSRAAQWQQYVPFYLRSVFGDPDQPDPAIDHLAIYGLKWSDAVLFANWQGKRLPSEREWEWAARGKESRTYPWGDAFDQDRVQYRKVIAGAPHPRSGPVTDYPRGGTPVTGILRMADGVPEWVADVWQFSAMGHPEVPCFRLGLGDAASIHRSARGASNLIKELDATATQCSNRGGYLPENERSLIGVRCAKSDPGTIRRLFLDR